MKTIQFYSPHNYVGLPGTFLTVTYDSFSYISNIIVQLLIDYQQHMVFLKENYKEKKEEKRDQHSFCIQSPASESCHQVLTLTVSGPAAGFHTGAAS
jgi:hypothetical protein